MTSIACAIFTDCNAPVNKADIGRRLTLSCCLPTEGLVDEDGAITIVEEIKTNDKGQKDRVRHRLYPVNMNDRERSEAFY